MKKVLVISGLGFVGDKVLKLFQAHTDWEVFSGGRSAGNDRLIDLNNPKTFEALRGF